MKPEEWTLLPARAYWLVAAGVVLAAISLRWVGLDAQSLWFDEGITLKYASLPDLFSGFRELAGVGRGSERLQLLNVVLVHFWIRLFGDSVFALHAFPALLGVAAVGGAWYAGRVLGGSRCGFWSAVFTAFSGYSVYYSQELRPYALLILVCFFQAAAYISLVRSPRVPGPGRRECWVFAACCTLGLATSVFSGVFTTALFVAHALLRRDVRILFRSWWPAAVCCLPVGLFYAWVVVFATSTDVGQSIPGLRQGSLLNMIFGIYGVVAGLTYGASLDELRVEGVRAVLRYAVWYVPVGMAVAVMTVSAARIVWDARTEKSHHTGPLVSLLLAGAGMCLFQVVFAVCVNFNLLPRHQFWLFPLIALGFGLLMSRGGRAARLAGLVVLVVNLVSSVSLHVDPRYAKDDFRGAVRFLRETTSGDRVVVNSGESLYAYYGLEGVVPLGEWDGLDKKHCFLELSAHGPVWLVLNRSYDTAWPDRKALEKNLSPELAVRRVVTFKNMKLYEIAPGSP